MQQATKITAKSWVGTPIIDTPLAAAQARQAAKSEASEYKPTREDREVYSDFVSSEARIISITQIPTKSPLISQRILQDLADRGKIIKVSRSRFCSKKLWSTFDADRRFQEAMQN